MSSDADYVEESDERLSSPGHPFPSSPPPINISPLQNVTSATNPLIPPATNNLFAQNDEDAKTYFTRPNRYFGPASTWKSWTEEERTVALSLDRVRSQDLSIHLFNAFHLKRKASEVGRERRQRKGRKGKERATSVASITEGDIVGGQDGAREDFSVPRTWTAWPMPPDQVPREELLPRAGPGGALSTTVDPRPSADLEGWLIATATKFARERWNDRQWEKQEADIPQGGIVEVDNGEADLEVDHALDAVESEAEDGYEQEHGEPGIPLFSSQAVSVSDESEGKASGPGNQESDDEDGVDRRPVPLADDDAARQYFLPTARHILSKLDQLLLGLHNARRAYAAKPQGRPRGRTSSRTPRNGPYGEDDGPRSASRQRPRSSSANSDISSASFGPSTRRDRMERFGLRDWSDVMGMAVLTGWDPAVVERASERCARLFGENMLFRTFHEGDAKTGTQAHFTEHFALDSASSVTSPEAHEVEMSASSVRTSAPCEACRLSGSSCQPADPNPNPGASHTCKQCQETGTDCSGISVRHTIPFRKRYHLQRHLDSVHRDGTEDEKWLTRSSASATASADVSDADTDFERSLGSDQPIVCPVPSCPRSHVAFREGRRLYEHVRRMHPEVDVEHLKAWETTRRGERRGKWRDERRRRSVSLRRSRSRNSRLRASGRGEDGVEDDGAEDDERG